MGVQGLRRTARTGRITALLAAPLLIIGVVSAVTQPGFADGTGPVLGSISFSPANTVDVSTADQSVAVLVQATDADSPIASGSVTLTNGTVVESFFFTAADLQSGTTDTYLTGAQTFGVADVGTWTVQSIDLLDTAGTDNSTATSTATLTVTATTDTVGPALTGAPTFSPSSVDPSTSDQTVTFNLHITDRVGGFDVGFAQLDDSTGDTIAFAFSSTSLTSGTITDGDYAVQFTVPTQQHSGTYQFTDLELFDRDANDSTIDTTGLPALSVTTRDVPGAPTALTATPGNAQVALNWTAPADPGSDPITGYVIEYSTDYAATWSDPSPTGSTATSATVTGLTNGTDYVFQVAAVSAAGTGAFSLNSEPVTPAASPTAPSDVVGVPGDGRVDLTWAPPTDLGGTPIIEYLVRRSTDGGTTWSDPDRTSSPAAGFAETGLTNGTAYLFEVAAATSAGPGPYSDPSAPITPAAVPGAPTAVTGTAGNAQVALTWTAPASDGGSPVTGYLVEDSTDGGTTWSDPIATGSTTTAFTVTGLTNGTGYVLRVAAVNAAGSGALSDPSATLTPVTVPGAPTAVTGTAGDAQVARTWTAPASDGGSPITGYLVEDSTNGGTTWSDPIATGSTTTAFTVTGLTNGTGYVLRVAAVNAVGTGAYSDPSATVTPMAPAPSSSTPPPPPTSSSAPPPPPVSSSTPPPPVSSTPTPTPTSSTPSPAGVDPTVLTASAPRFVRYGHRLTISGRLLDATSGRPMVHATLTLWSHTAGHAFMMLATRSTSTTGKAHFTLRAKANIAYRWTFAGSATGTKSSSRTQIVHVRQTVTAALRTLPGGSRALWGTVAPTAPVTVNLQRLVQGHWRSRGSATVSMQLLPDGTRRAGYLFTLAVSKPGTYRFRVHRPATASLAAGSSRTVTVTIPR
ncbi:MAG TPA: fibronectin type III domain-containing protein [Jatrophihabitantaceae bacterium]|nr:fibronectin type III domain-containing protein [Jatrophihabitantaceae bacterium]